MAEAKPVRRVKLGILLITLSCFLSIAPYARQSPQVHSLVGGNTTPAAYERRFAGLRGVLPAYGVVGYLGDTRYEPANYYLAQYSLAPLLLEHSAEHSLIVGDFDASAMASGAAWPSHLMPLQDFGDGVVLLGKRER
jgi:hypothetical protein